MRIAYGVHGYGRGHATRALAVLAELQRRHDVLVLAGGDAYDALSASLYVQRIPTLGYSYGRNGTRSNWLTLRDNFPLGMDLICGGGAMRLVADAFADFCPDVVISDAEPWSTRVARRTGVPRIGFDHFGVLAYCRPEMSATDRLILSRDVAVYRWLMQRPERVIVSSFYDAPARRDGVTFVGPLLRDEVLRRRPRDGEHLLGYFNKGEHLFSPRIEAALRELGQPVIIYGARRRGREGNLLFKTTGDADFLDDLASCRAVFSTAGNQLVGEAMHFGKPLLVTPEDCVEQRVNARGVERLGIGRAIAQARVSVEVLRDFLDRLDEHRENVIRHARDGRGEALTAIESYIDELANGARRRVAARVA